MPKNIIIIKTGISEMVRIDNLKEENPNLKWLFV